VEAQLIQIRAAESRRSKLILWAAVSACLLAVPLVATKTPYLLHIFIIISIYTSLVWGLDLLVGCGLISCAQIAFWGIGSYTYAITLLRLGLNPWIALLGAGIVPALLSVLLSYTSIRLKSMYWCLFSIIFAVIFQQSLLVWRPFLGGAEGISGIPKLPLIESYAGWYYLALFLFLLTGAVVFQVRRSRMGLILDAMSSELLARSAGISIGRYRLICLIVANFFAGLMGGFFAAYTGAASPANVGLESAYFIFVYLVVGGRKSLGGCLVGTSALIFLRELLGPLGVYISVIYGSIVLVFLLFLPGGLGSLPEILLARYRGRQQAS
jgi:branched-chain amino acid transport system permease protein